MKKLLFTSSFLIVAFTSIAQEPDATQLHETAKQFMRSGDWANAVLILNKALVKEPANFPILKDLALTYYYQRDFAKARETVKPLLERGDADVQIFQIAGSIYKQLAEAKEADKVYKKGLKLFPGTGVLYADYGELLWLQKDFGCIEQWETGIKSDPNYSGNYYFAAKYYHLTDDKIWALIYGEMFINMESYTSRTAEVKTMLLESYKSFFNTNSKTKAAKPKTEFSDAFMSVMNRNVAVTNSGVTTESLIMLRTRFILDWYNEFNSKMPLRLFEHQRQLLQDGMFEAYNQWIFEAAGDLSSYENWTKLNAEQYIAFTKFQKSKIFKVPAGQYYQKSN